MFKRSIRCLPTYNRQQYRFFFKAAPSPEETAATVEKVKKALQENPELMKLTLEFKQLLTKKGLMNQSNLKPSLTTMMKLLSDSEIREHGNKLKKFLDESNINISKEELAVLNGAMFKGKDI
ncbi:unnamed protein product [Candida verbasci]|uniref:Uncharacterized protein n=1 Tax=Candida verbasci TaxID=1227364 RepID=A0A9W4TZX6_9ASCO|nr:unnamed protein product [Candida verbasci]